MRHIAMTLWLSTGVMLLVAVNTVAGLPDHVRRTRNQCALPNHPYGRDREVDSAAELTLPAIQETVVVQSADFEQFSDRVPGGRAPWTGLVPPAKESVLALPGFEPTTRSKDGALLRNLPAYTRTRDKVPTTRPLVLRQKRFRLRVSTVALAAVRLDNVSLAVDELGRLDTTGTLLHTGGPTGDLLGGQVTVRLQALAGPADGTGPILWQSADSSWLTKGQPRTQPLVNAAADPQLRGVFDQIEQFRLILEHRRDR